jgi:hypothetical protein
MKNCPPGVLCLNYSKIVLIVIIVLFFLYSIKTEWVNSTSKIIENNMDNIKIIQKENKLLDNKLEEIKLNDKIKENIHSSNNNATLLINKSYERIHNPLLPPERSNHFINSYSHVKNVGIPINIQTRGEVGDYQQVGALVNEHNNKILPIYGRPNYQGSSKWSYYTSPDKFREVKLPVFKHKKNCTDDFGCDEIYDKDEINVPGYTDNFKVSLYGLDKPKYLPFI